MLGLLTNFALASKVPMGVVVDENNTLCSQKTFSESSPFPTNVSELSSILAGNHYSMKPMEDGGGYLVFPEKLSQKQTQILSLKISRFDPPPATLHTLGVFLDGQIEMTLHPDYGFAGNIPYSLDAQQVVLVLANKTVQEVSNAIVRSGGKGVWIMPYLPPGDAVKGSLVEFYGYDEDAVTISHLQCSTVK